MDNQDPPHGRAAPALGSGSAVAAPGRPLSDSDGDIEGLARRRPDMAAVDRSCRAIASMPRPGPEEEARLLVRALRCIDLTDLSSTSTEGRVRGLAAQARRPLAPEVAAGLGPAAADLHVAAVCVYPSLVPAAVAALAGSGVRVASVAGCFPDALSSMSVRVADVAAAVDLGADEVDVPVRRGLALAERWRDLYSELVQLRTAAPGATLKVIVSAGDLPDAAAVYRTAWCAMTAGADFIKTSTGREPVNATLPTGIVIAQAIRAFAQEHGRHVGLKPAGGLTTAPDALDWLALATQELGAAGCRPGRFRIGASALAGALAERLGVLASGTA